MRKFLLVAAALAAIGGPASAANVVVLANEPGGSVPAYIAKYQQLDASGAQVQLKGSCTSACVMITGIVRNLCAWPGTVLRIHAAHHAGYTELMASHFSPGVRAWAERNGALKSPELRSVAASAVGIRSCR
jgi:opacity protein-like surface antigen